ncbi:hypothetical protein JHK85_010235 [Glycine max]|nr:hypothetical protein JHK85_010235 [Glycine max]
MRMMLGSWCKSRRMLDMSAKAIPRELAASSSSPKRKRLAVSVRIVTGAVGTTSTFIDEALASLHHAGAISVIRSAPNSLEDAEVERFKLSLSLIKRFQDLRYDVSS